MPTPRTLMTLLAVALGLLSGLGFATFQYAEGASYLSTDPVACVNCHIMQPQYDSWQKASHHTMANCVDCHLPPGFPDKYLAKAEHGWNHSKGFTLQDFHEPIRLSPRSAEALQENCLRCHGDLVHGPAFGHEESAPRCVRCHDDVGHGPRAGLGGPFRGVAEERAAMQALRDLLTELPHSDALPESQPPSKNGDP